MTIHKLWTLCIVGEPEDGGTPVLHVGRLTDEEHDRPEDRSRVEDSAHKYYAVKHPGHVITSEWWACEEKEVREL